MSSDDKPARKARPRPPRGLGKAGARLWADLLDEYELDPHELRLLTELCHQIDTVEELQAAIDADGAMIPTVGGTSRKVNPAVPEIRQARLVVARLCAALRLPSTDDEAPGGRGQQRGGPRGVYQMQAQRS